MSLRRFAVCVLLCSSGAMLFAQSRMKVGGESLFPSELMFVESDPKSQATGGGELSNGCRWEVQTSTRYAPYHTNRDCVHYFYRTTVTLTQRCEAPRRPQIKISERVTGTGPFCATEDKPIPPARTEALGVSSGRVPDGKTQDIIDQPDGTRVTIQASDSSVEVRVTYPDRTIDLLRWPD